MNLPLTPSRGASSHFSWYWFSVPLRLGGWVGLGCLGEILRWFACPKTVTHPTISRGGRESNSRAPSRESNVLTTRLPRHPSVNVRFMSCIYVASKTLYRLSWILIWLISSAISPTVPKFKTFAQAWQFLANEETRKANRRSHRSR